MTNAAHSLSPCAGQLHMNIAKFCIPQQWSVSPTHTVPEHRELSLTQYLHGRSVPGSSDKLGGEQAVLMKGGPLSTQSFTPCVGQSRY